MKQKAAIQHFVSIMHAKCTAAGHVCMHGAQFIFSAAAAKQLELPAADLSCRRPTWQPCSGARRDPVNK